MYEAGMSKSEIARRLSIGRTSVRRMLEDDGGSQSAHIGADEAEERER
jgi:DNA-binding transcriptional regulator LsrR (DeoR family)